MIYRIHCLILGLLIFNLVGCSNIKFSQWHFPYMMEVQQGNYITKKQLDELKIGLPKEQIVFIIGHPLTQFMFDQKRWDFIYQDYKNNQLIKSYHLSLFFDLEDKLTKMTKDGVTFAN